MAEDPFTDYVIAADLGGTHLRVAVIDRNGTIRSRSKVRTPTQKAEQIVRVLADAARECIADAEAHSVTAISAVVPGATNLAAGSIVRAPNVPCLEGFPFREAVSRELGLPALIENDANAAAVGEMWIGAARGHRTLVCLTLGTGVGGGVILDGQLWRGKDGAAGEIGHMTIDAFTGPLCSCGGRGCLEVFASATGIVRMTREALPRYPKSSLQNVDALTARDVYRAGADGDELALQIFARMGNCLGAGLGNMVNLLNPEIIVLGGGVAAGWDLFAEPMRKEMKERAFAPAAAEVPVVRAECGDDAGILGAARLAFDQIEEVAR